MRMNLRHSALHFFLPQCGRSARCKDRIQKIEYCNELFVVSDANALLLHCFNTAIEIALFSKVRHANQENHQYRDHELSALYIEGGRA